MDRPAKMTRVDYASMVIGRESGEGMWIVHITEKEGEPAHVFVSHAGEILIDGDSLSFADGVMEAMALVSRVRKETEDSKEGEAPPAEARHPMSAPEFFAKAGLKTTSGWKLVRNGLIPVIRPPATRRVLISHETLERFLAGEFNDAPRSAHHPRTKEQCNGKEGEAAAADDPTADLEEPEAPARG